MCGIFGVISKTAINRNHLKILAFHARQRGRDSSGIIYSSGSAYHIKKADCDIQELLKTHAFPLQSQFAAGHSRLITNGLSDNQPVFRDEIALIHNGIVTNHNELWNSLNVKRIFEIDSEIIIGIALECLRDGVSLNKLPSEILSRCKGTISAALIFPLQGKICLFTNNGSLYLGRFKDSTYFSSEEYPLKVIGCTSISQVPSSGLGLDLPVGLSISCHSQSSRISNLIPKLVSFKNEEKLLSYPLHALKRCTKCILPETMPYISFDEAGICNYCNNYINRNKPKPKHDLFNLLQPYRRNNGAECIVPFSGGRDSCWALHLIVKELGLKAITYTYDWGMITDLGRRNISRMCSSLGVENIIVAANIEKKRRNIALNLSAWLKSPNLGMISILTAGDKHFFRHVETVKRQTGVCLNLWGINPLEVTHFKSGFLGLPPDFYEKRVYTHGLQKQLAYQSRRFKAIFKNPRYFNVSLWDTLSGEYYRSFTEKKDYFHLFDYWRWDENLCNEVLANYDWELASDTTTTWRIGDGTAAFYNYVYYLVAGFTEHDTFRSNQIREGQISREEALEFVGHENRPRYQNIKWYLDVLGMDFSEVITIVNSIPPVYSLS
jgi:glucosamine--fructose-6-phosphate aminotransferase (isomerizing)